MVEPSGQNPLEDASNKVLGSLKVIPSWLDIALKRAWVDLQAARESGDRGWIERAGGRYQRLREKAGL